MNLKQFLSTVFVLFVIQQSNGLVEEAIDIIKLGKEVTVSLLETWDIIEQTHMVNEVDIPFYKKKEKKILSRMTELSRQLDLAELEVSMQTFLLIPIFHLKCMCHTICNVF